LDWIAILVLGVGVAANGVIMLIDPVDWYSAVPGALDAGPLNPHFVRDVGAAYLVAGAALAWFSFDPRVRMAAVAGASFLTLHALVHAAEALGHHTLVSDFELLNTGLPAAVGLWAVWPDSKSRAYEPDM
jgi:hypothetical protein